MDVLFEQKSFIFHVMNFYRPVLKIALIGYGNVAKAFVKLLHEKAAQLPFSPAISGVYTRTLGFRWLPDKAFLPEEILANLPGPRRIMGGASKFIERIEADVLVELTVLDKESGEPAAEYIRTALNSGKHVVTANKGPIAYFFHELHAISERQKLRLRFESSVADGLPIFSLFRYGLPASKIVKIRGVLNSTANYVLARMAKGVPESRAVGEAQASGIAEANPEFDLDGWDGAMKAVILGNVLMKGALSPRDVVRDSFSSRASELISRAAKIGGKPQQIVRLERVDNKIEASVRLQATQPDDPLFPMSGFDNGLTLESDTMGRILLVEKAPSLRQTAFGVLSDLIDVYYRGVLPKRPPSLFDVEPG